MKGASAVVRIACVVCVVVAVVSAVVLAVALSILSMLVDVSAAVSSGWKVGSQEEVGLMYPRVVPRSRCFLPGTSVDASLQFLRVVLVTGLKCNSTLQQLVCGAQPEVSSNRRRAPTKELGLVTQEEEMVEAKSRHPRA